MTWQRAFRLSAAALAIVAVLYFVLGSLYVRKASQREETWHEQAVASADAPNMVAWYALRGQRPVVEWRYFDAKRHNYIVRLFDDRKYVSAVFGHVASGVPRQYETGTLSRAEWSRLKAAVESMYAQRETLFAHNQKNVDDIKLAYSRDNAVPVTFSYSSADYALAPPLHREFDSLLFATMAAWSVKPHHGYARPGAAVDYSLDALPNLIRGLGSEREAAYPSIVARMVALGEPALAPLTAVLEAGAQTNYLPISRYVAVIDGISALGGRAGHGYALIRTLAEAPASLPGRKALKQHAATVLGAHEVRAYMTQHWALPAERERPFAPAVLPTTQQQALDAALAARKDPLKARRHAARDALIELGPGVLPAVLAQIQTDHAHNYFGVELLEVLAQLGGSDGFVYAIREHDMSPSHAVKPLAGLGEEGAAGLLMLLEAPDRGARREAFYVLDNPEYAGYAALYIEQLSRRIALYRGTSAVAVRALLEDAAVHTCKLLKQHGAAAAAVDILVEIAVDTEQADATRVAALAAIATMDALPGHHERALKALAGYESGRVYKALDEALSQIGGQ